MSVKSIKYRVAKGIKLLNKEYGRSWLRRINPERLALESYTYCILGQLEGSYFTGKNLLGIDSGAYYGFEGDEHISHDALTEVWRQEITRLRSKI